MDFGFGEDQELLRTTTRRFLTEHQSLADLRRSLEEPGLFDPGIWRQGAELGWTAVLMAYIEGCLCLAIVILAPPFRITRRLWRWIRPTRAAEKT